ncbi:Sideroflexin-3-like [Oopsacas minuta]|uniref:Sidoreflexin n=1 Tax=Oopsacas minuta TaxID=111878 RepID=A0AAV7JMP1_9METZ|nr:Sideroflexin-3-like [Oopsacas minuta]
MEVIDITQPRWKQNTFLGRFKHFTELTHPKHMFHSSNRLNKADKIISGYKSGEDNSLQKLSIKEQWRIKYIYDSAFHPDTGDKMLLPFRMCAQIPSAILIVSGILTYHHTLSGVLFWQWFNQSYCATLNFTNRNATSKVTNKHILMAYTSATTGAVAVSVLLNRMVTTTHSLSGRLVPFLAITMANAINIPLMRQNELKDGVTVSTEGGESCGSSRRAAAVGIFQTLLGRLVFAGPSFIFSPIIYTRLIRHFPILHASKSLSIIIQGLLTGLLYIPSIPLGCSLFPQRSHLSVNSLEHNVKQCVQRKHPNAKYVYFNKGL